MISEAFVRRIRILRERWRGRKFYICHAVHEHDRIYSENIREYLGQIGLKCQVLEFNPPGQRHELLQCIDDNPIGIIGFNTQLDHCWVDDNNFVDAAAKRNVPVIHWIVDHPCSRWLEFNNPAAANARFLMVSDYCERYFQRYARTGARTAMTFGVGPNRRSRTADLLRQSFLRREVRCLIPLNLRRIGGASADIEARIEKLGPLPAAAVRNAIKRARLDLSGPLETHLEATLAELDLKVPDRTFHTYFQAVDEMTQIWRRLKIFETAARFPVVVQTDVPPPQLMQGAIATFKSDPQSTSAISTMALMKSSRAVLSLSLTNDMLHDRVANGLNAGCVAIIEDNTIHRRLFEHGKNALLFRYDDDSLEQCLDLVCNDPDRAYKVAQEGFAMRDRRGIRFGNFHNILELAWQ